MVCYGVWYGMVWMVWCGMVWMVRYSTYGCPLLVARLPPSVVAPTHDLVIYAFDTVSTVDLFTVGGTPSPK